MVPEGAGPPGGLDSNTPSLLVGTHVVPLVSMKLSAVKILKGTKILRNYFVDRIHEIATGYEKFEKTKSD